MFDEYAEINDIREENDFKGITFSNFKKNDVKKALLSSLIDENIEPSCYWSVELICAGHYGDLWEIIIFFYSKYIHLGNPKLSVFINLRIENFKSIVHSGYSNQELRLRNNHKIRKLFVEIIGILCKSKRRHSINTINIQKSEFVIENLENKLKAPDTSYIDSIFLPEDPKELFIPINELLYSISSGNKNTLTACYWIEWIFEYENICKNKKQKLECERRMIIPVDSKFQKHIIWILWDGFIKESLKRDKLTQTIINAALGLFTLKYSYSCNKKRKYIIYFVISLLCENLTVQEDIISKTDKEFISTIIQNNNILYKEIKKNEISPNTDYLFENTKKQNLDSTIKKIEQINIFEDSFIPRI